VPLLFAATLFISASLLFMVQPMVGKMVLPLLGGSPAVWNACMVFFQALLLLGYLYAHFVAGKYEPKKQWLIHLVVLGLPIGAFLLAVMFGARHSPIAIAESHWRVWSPANRADLARGPVITWASRTPARLASSLGAAAVLRRSRAKVLRIGVHPPDVNHPALVKSIERTLSHVSANRRIGRYSDLLV